jgi:hypothetical protein
MEVEKNDSAVSCCFESCILAQNFKKIVNKRTSVILTRID